MMTRDQSNKTHLISSNKFEFLLFLVLLWTLAVAQPVMEMLGSGPTFLVAHDLRGWPLVLATFTLFFICPLLLWVGVCLVGLVSSFIKEWFARLLTLLLLTLFLLPYVNNFEAVVAITIAVICAIILLFFITKPKPFSTVALWISPLVLIYFGHFLFISPASQLLPAFSSSNGDTQNSSAAQNPLYVIVLDEFPLTSILKNKKEINKSRFPALAEFSENATWYPNAKAISSATELALPAILTGINPINYGGRISTHEQFPQNLFSQLSQSHHINAVESTTRMCPPHLCQLNPPGSTRLLIEDTTVIYLHRISPIDVRKKLPSINDRWIGYLQELKDEKEVTTFSKRQEKFNSFISSFEQFPKNTVHFLHVLIPHAPWNMLPDLKLYGFYEPEGTPGQLSKNDPNASVAHQWMDDSWATELAWRKHLLQVGAADTLIKKAIDKIKDLGFYEQAMIIIVADHGSSFIPGLSRRFAHQETISSIASIPLLIKYPEQKTGVVDNREASNMDIYPTILDVYGISYAEEKRSGLSLLHENSRTSPLDMVQEGGAITPLTGSYSSTLKTQLETQNDLFPGDGWHGIFKTKQNEMFYELPVSELEIINIHANSISLLNANLFDQAYSPSSHYIPAYYRLKHLVDEEVSEILVSIKDQIVSHCFIFKHAINECAGLIDPTKLYSQDDNNSLNLRFFSIISKDNQQIIVDELLEYREKNATLVQAETQSYIQFESGLQSNIDRLSPVYGTATLHMINDNATYQLYGWAGNTTTGKPATSIYLFIDEKLYTVVRTGMSKPYLLDQFGLEELTKSGYQITIPSDQLPDLENHTLQVFAADDNGHMAELNYSSNSQNPQLSSAFNKKNNRKVESNSELIFNNLIKQTSDETPGSIIDALDPTFDDFIGGDWYKLTNKRRWIGHKVFVVVPPSQNKKSLTLSLRARPFVQEGFVENQRLEIYLNNEKIEEITFNESKSHEVVIKLKPELLGNPIKLMLNMPDAIAPADIGESKDVRALSFALSKFEVELK